MSTAGGGTSQSPAAFYMSGLNGPGINGGQAPPPPPPKAPSQEPSRLGTPAGNGAALPEYTNNPSQWQHAGLGEQHAQVQAGQSFPSSTETHDTLGPEYLPSSLENKTTQDLAHALSTPSLLTALAAQDTPPSPALLDALQQNIQLAKSLVALEQRLQHQRQTTQARLLQCHALERGWRAKQVEMDEVLAPFAPKALYMRLSAAVSEQEALSDAMIDTFLDRSSRLAPDGEAGNLSARHGDKATEKEVTDWLKRVRDARKVYWRRKEAKARWEDGRVGGWR